MDAAEFPKEVKMFVISVVWEYMDVAQAAVQDQKDL